MTELSRVGRYFEIIHVSQCLQDTLYAVLTTSETAYHEPYVVPFAYILSHILRICRSFTSQNLIEFGFNMTRQTVVNT
jgi:hypothetical protein